MTTADLIRKMAAKPYRGDDDPIPSVFESVVSMNYNLSVIGEEIARLDPASTGTYSIAIPFDISLEWIIADAQAILDAMGVKDLADRFVAEYERATAKHQGMTLDCDGHTDETRFYALAEEVGEVAASLTYDNQQGTGHQADTIAEVTQVGALALAWLTRYQEGGER